MIKVLHITAHLGGGVGKALSGLVAGSISLTPLIKHTIVTLEKQEKAQFIERIRSCGCNVIVCPRQEDLNDLIQDSDIVQLEWWNHPATLKALCNTALPSMRLLVWCHISGLYNPIIPKGLIHAADRFLFTSPCSYEAPGISDLLPIRADQIGVVSSSGGFDDLNKINNNSENLSVGYIGSLNFAKLHPRYVDFVSAVKKQDFQVRVIGDLANKEILEHQCEIAGRKRLLEFRGYTNDVASELSSVNVLAYLLNPEHYGTSENALLEAMAAEIVPIVLNNPAERHIVDHENTGFIVSTPIEFAGVIEWLSQNPSERKKIGKQAAESVRSRFSVEKMTFSLNDHYKAISTMAKRSIAFTDIFGSEPGDWFLACQCNPALYLSDTDSDRYKSGFSVYGLVERTKGTIFHFMQYFPNDSKLNEWANRIRRCAM